MVVKGDGRSMRKAIAGALLVLALALAFALFQGSVAASGQFSPMSYGFPNIVHSLSNTAWVHDTANAFDFEDASIVPMGGYFPAIHQTSIHTRSMSHMEYSHTEEFTAIGYPYTSAGPGPYGGFACGY